MPLRLIALLAVLMFAIAGLLTAFALSFSAASRAFEHALISQREAEVAQDIARDADALKLVPLRQSLISYRDLIGEERQFLSASENRSQLAEIRRAAELSSLADSPAGRAGLATAVRSIVANEQREIVQARADLYRARADTLAFGLLLAAAAMLAAATGAVQLHRANRDLADEVAARTAELQAVDKSRRLFFAKASHELRTPVTAIRTIAEVALGSRDADTPLRDIVAQAGFLGHRIDEMLALAAAGDGRPSLSLSSTDLAEMLAGVRDQSLAYARSIEVTIAVRLPPGPVRVLADRSKLAQAVLAVIDNGLKFSDPGETLELRLAWDGTSALITVTDSGPGILARELPRIFDAYYQADAGRMRGGTGLGLALARWVVEQHGGSIHAENLAACREPDGGRHGCRIVMRLPPASDDGR